MFCYSYAAVKEDTLLDMVSAMTENTGLVHQMPFVCDREGFAAVLEKVNNAASLHQHHSTTTVCCWKNTVEINVLFTAYGEKCVT